MVYSDVRASSTRYTRGFVSVNYVSSPGGDLSVGPESGEIK